MKKLKIQRKLKNFNSNVKTKINNEIKRKGKKGTTKKEVEYYNYKKHFNF